MAFIDICIMHAFSYRIQNRHNTFGQKTNFKCKEHRYQAKLHYPFYMLWHSLDLEMNRIRNNTLRDQINYDQSTLVRMLWWFQRTVKIWCHSNGRSMTWETKSRWRATHHCFLRFIMYLFLYSNNFNTILVSSETSRDETLARNYTMVSLFRLPPSNLTWHRTAWRGLLLFVMNKN